MAIDQNILVTVDTLVFRITDEENYEVLLIERKNDPFQGQWALPGGFVEDDEDLPTAAIRELEEETGIGDLVDLEQYKSYGKPGRDPRGRTVTCVFYGFLSEEAPKENAGSDAADAKWFSIYQLPDLAFDHALILSDVKEHLGL